MKCHFLPVLNVLDLLLLVFYCQYCRPKPSEVLLARPSTRSTASTPCSATETHTLPKSLRSVVVTFILGISTNERGKLIIQDYLPQKSRFLFFIFSTFLSFFLFLLLGCLKSSAVRPENILHLHRVNFDEIAVTPVFFPLN